jgi:hypothetical protein
MTLRYTDTVYAVITETAPPPIDAATSTRIAYVSSTTYETVSETVTQTATAPTVTVTPGPYTVAAPADFTPIASNPSNAGADTFAAVLSSTSTQDDGQLTTSSTDSASETAAVQSSTGTQDDEQLMTSSTDTASDTVAVQSWTTTQEEQQAVTTGTDPDATIDAAPPGMRRLLANGLHVRAEKSFSNVNRVICDETTTFVVTSVRPFTVRHTTLSSTATVQGVNDVEFPTVTNFQTITEFQVPYADVVETVAITETETSSIYETTTVTPTYERTDLPRSTVYAACGADNIIGGIADYGVVQVAPTPIDRTDISATQVPEASSAQSCCEACVSQTERTCAGSVWWQNVCYFILVSSQCSGSEEVIAFDVSRDREFSAFGDMVMSNGACGQQVWSGRYCDRYDNNCVTDPVAANI